MKQKSTIGERKERLSEKKKRREESKRKGGDAFQNIKRKTERKLGLNEKVPHPRKLDL